MPSLNFMMFFLFLSILSYPISFATAADPTYVSQLCSNGTTFTSNSTYESNLNLLLSSLRSNASRNNAFSTGFFNDTVGQDPNKIYGMFVCRGDQTTSSCQDCVNFATRNATQRCPFEKELIIWYDQCLLRYSNQSFFSTVDASRIITMWNTQNITDPDKFNDLVGNLMNEAATEAVDNPKKFAAKKEDFTVFQQLYGLVQCTPDLSSSGCNLCLRDAISRLPGCCSGKQGGRVLLPSCIVRYEVYPFYNESNIAAPAPAPEPVPPTPPSPGSGTRPKGKSGISSSTIIAIVAPISVSAVLFIAGFCFLRRRAKKQYNAVPEGNADNDITTLESLQFDLGTIEVATNRFSTDNKLGEGGFGEVYKGVLPNGEEIAVKRLSKSSGQGAEEFKNEVVLVAKLQHRNLVRLLGFCLEGEEKILVYEYVPNKSLDSFLYEPEKQGQLDWSKRYKIIGGIARGILYLHEDSRLRIIHRDLKASNILLDADMNPKISDFGMARIFGVDQTQGNTSRIVGTFGYMSPEYAMHGHFSVKSDVYSFGVLVLEIITGKKNNNFYQTDGAEDLLSYAWKHWRDGTPMELLDSTLTDSYSRNEVIQCIHLGLLCVQEDPAERPSMATVVLMLNSYSVTLPSPQKPAFFLGTQTGRNMFMKEIEYTDKSTSKSIPLSVDEASITEVYPR
ncbi:Cysteine rich receptor like kinase [Melia azedarach]|uniref:Cysteine rich receptor like kinase n=2 Tax=Melia azedarach TaxID=155640 RepID=A0ACC1WX71_MELAZ|nr:Cysteine rich receptor like kinase [Melia azedarach]KAJ4703242.1 Cysteine rich receptor like kinase [Melia azedarach]